MVKRGHEVDLEYSKKEIAETLKVISSDIKKSNLKKEGKFLKKWE